MEEDTIHQSSKTNGAASEDTITTEFTDRMKDRALLLYIKMNLSGRLLVDENSSLDFHNVIGPLNICARNHVDSGVYLQLIYSDIPLVDCLMQQRSSSVL